MSSTIFRQPAESDLSNRRTFTSPGQTPRIASLSADSDLRSTRESPDWLDWLVPHSAETPDLAFRWILPAFDLIVILLAFSYSLGLAVPFGSHTGAELAVAGAIGWIAAGHAFGIYGAPFLRLDMRRLAGLAGLWSFTVLIIGGASAPGFAGNAAESWRPLLVSGAIGLLLVRLSVWVLAGRFILRGGASQQIVLLSEADSDAMVQRVHDERPNASITVIGLSPSGYPKTVLRGPMPADEVVIALGPEHCRFTPIVTELCRLPVAVSTLEPHKTGGLVRLRSRPLSGGAQVAKRIFDLVASSMLLLLFAPLMLLFALVIKASDPAAPVFYLQRRHGFNQAPFVTYKFRTMGCGGAGEVAKQATKEDSRVTRIGKFLRASSMDELPQLVNVFLGDMSIVGPRPHPMWLNEQFAKVLSRYLERHRVKPGITGLAQVNGLRGETDTIEKMKRRVELDLLYIQKWSLWLDVVILFKTIKAILNTDNAY